MRRLTTLLLISIVGFALTGCFWNDDDGGTQVTTPSTATPASGDGSTVLTEDRVREIATEVVDKAVANDSSITASQIKELVDKAVADAMVTIAKTGGLTEEQVKAIVTSALDGASASATTTGTPATGSSAQVSAWPTSPAEAATTFAPESDPTRWEETAEGGWHMREEPFSVLLNPRGFLAEGYFDTKPGRNPQCFAFVVPMGVQGATVWQEEGTRANATALQAKMAIPKWDDGSSDHPCEVMAQ